MALWVGPHTRNGSGEYSQVRGAREYSQGGGAACTQGINAVLGAHGLAKWEGAEMLKAFPEATDYIQEVGQTAKERGSPHPAAPGRL